MKQLIMLYSRENIFITDQTSYVAKVRQLLYDGVFKLQTFIEHSTSFYNILLLKHTLRTFHDSNGLMVKQDSGIWVQPMDYNGLNTIKDISFYKNIEKFECDGSYCGLPYYFPMRKIVRWVFIYMYNIIWHAFPTLLIYIFQKVMMSIFHRRR